MNHRKPRIAWSAACWTAAPLFITLWVRGFWTVTNVQLDFLGYVSQVVLSRGTLHCSASPTASHYFTRSPDDDFSNGSWTLIRSYSRPEKEYDEYSGHPDFPQFIFRFHNLGTGLFWIVVPYWFLALGFTIAGVLPHIAWSLRFRLRTLLIATTLVAVGLGLIVWLR